ncbi:hypothetical protein EVAR_65216_1 [Eumeta japonica]|uniref:Uncharacterized protein n=1 Tax=Eumeta variegata TaxID=151549 RepID=A0A4C2A915_EUMVA|nr:hypothetical protein EVAR_65216_1 [Eumeta japonica]
MYGSESWVWRNKNESRINTMEIRSLRSMCGVSRTDRCRNSDVKERCCLKEDVVSRVEKYLSEHTGTVVENYEDIERIYSTLKIEIEHNYSLPCWTRSVFPFGMEKPACHSFRVPTLERDLARIKAGPLLKNIVHHMTEAAQRSDPSRRRSCGRRLGYQIPDLLKWMHMGIGCQLEGLDWDKVRARVCYRRRARNDLECHPVLKVSAELYHRLIKVGFVYVGLQRRPVWDQSPLVQCSATDAESASAKKCTRGARTLT